MANENVVFSTMKYRIYPDKEARKRIDFKLDQADLAFNKYADHVNALKWCGFNEQQIVADLMQSESNPKLAAAEEEYVKKQVKKLVPRLASGEIDEIYHRNRFRGHRTVGIKRPQIKEQTAAIDGVGDVPIVMHRSLPADACVYSIALNQDCFGAEYYLVFGYRVIKSVAAVQKPDPERVIGLDYAQNGLYVDSDGVSGGYPGIAAMGRSQLTRYRENANHFIVGSTRWKKHQRRLKKCEKHIRNQQENWQYNKAGYLAENYDAVCCETLDFNAMREENPKLTNKIRDNNWHGFEKKLERKLKKEGKQLVKIPKYYPSSQVCSGCGYRVGKLPCSEREFVCPKCGLKIDRDVNAARNIREKGISILQAV